MATVTKGMAGVVVFVVSIIVSAQVQQRQHNGYFGQLPPTHTPTVFAPGVVSDGLGNRDMAISPAGDELFYTIQQPRGTVSVIMYAQKVNGKWSSPQVADFSGYYNDLEPAFSPDGLTLYFSSNRPLVTTGKTKDYDIWIVKKVSGKWVQPTNAGGTINSDKDEFYPQITKSGNVYFTKDMGDSKEDIVVARYSNGTYSPPVSLPAAVNSSGFEFNAYVDPDESVIIFTAYKRGDDMGGGDLYISTKKPGAEWSPAHHLGPAINSTAIDYCPFLSADKRYLFFTSSRSSIKSPMDHRVNVKQLKLLLTSAGNGSDDIHWVDAKGLLNQ